MKYTHEITNMKSTAKQRLVTNFESIQCIAKLCKKCRVKYLRHRCKNNDFRMCVREVAHNLLKSNIPLSTKQKRQLNRIGKTVKDVTGDRNYHQAGGFLNIAIPILASIVSELIASKVSK